MNAYSVSHITRSIIMTRNFAKAASIRPSFRKERGVF